MSCNDEKSYRIIKTLGSGKNGDVYLVKDKKGRDLVLKTIKILGAGSNSHHNEVIMKLLNIEHPNIIKILCYDILDSGKALIIYDYIQGSKDMTRVIKICETDNYCLTYKQKLYIMIKLIDVLHFLKNNSIVHGDIKPDNILFKITKDGNYEPLLIDFDVSCEFYDAVSVNKKHDNCNSSRNVGTPLFKSPVSDANSNYSNDIYSLGLTLLCLFATKQQPPWFSYSSDFFSNASLGNIKRKNLLNSEKLKGFIQINEANKIINPSGEITGYISDELSSNVRNVLNIMLSSVENYSEIPFFEMNKLKKLEEEYLYTS